jgi:raffinose/stachyose/melibiose transport system substrate-binding protein
MASFEEHARYQLGDVVGQFASGKGAYYIDGTARGAYITDKSTGEALIDPKSAQKDIVLTVFPDIAGAKVNKSTSAVAGTGWAMSAAIPAGSAKEAAAWKLVKFLESKEIQSWRVETGAAPSPSRTDIDASKLKLEPMQMAVANLSKQYTATNVVYRRRVCGDGTPPSNQGLQEIEWEPNSPPKSPLLCRRLTRPGGCPEVICHNAIMVF